jgi:hypothetical protein
MPLLRVLEICWREEGELSRDEDRGHSSPTGALTARPGCLNASRIDFEVRHHRLCGILFKKDSTEQNRSCCECVNERTL